MTANRDRDANENGKQAHGAASPEGDRSGRHTSPGIGAEAGGEPAPELPEASADERMAALVAERDDLKDRMLRIAAEFENWKKRSRKEQTDAVAQARESVLKDVLEVVDNLERATGAHGQATGNGAADGAAVLKGVNLVLRLFQQKLERYDVKPFDARGQAFDPRVHEAISRVESAEVPAGSVAVELQKGYRVGDRLLRPALVSVSTGPKASEG